MSSRSVSSRFGAVSPAQAFQTKIRWILGCLGFIIVTLVVTIVAIIGNSANPQLPLPAATTGVASEISNTPTAGILVAVQRVEEGATIRDEMIKVHAISPDRIPDGALLASEKPEILNKFARNLLRPNMPILREDITSQPSLGSLNIPPGFRAVTITVDKRSGVEGWAKPNSRVDILWTYRDKDSDTKVATIVRFTKILSVEGATSNDGQQKAAVSANTTVTVLVTEKDAKKVELARNLGSLSLSLVGETVGEGPKLGSPEVVTIDSILGTGQELKVADEPVQGKMYAKDPKSGRTVLYVLKKGRWVLDTSMEKGEAPHSALNL